MRIWNDQQLVSLEYYRLQNYFTIRRVNKRERKWRLKFGNWSTETPEFYRIPKNSIESPLRQKIRFEKPRRTLSKSVQQLNSTQFQGYNIASWWTFEKSSFTCGWMEFFFLFRGNIFMLKPIAVEFYASFPLRAFQNCLNKRERYAYA